MVAPIMHIRHGNKFRLHHRQSASQPFFYSIWTPTLMRCYKMTSKLKACATHEQHFKYSATGHEPRTWQSAAWQIEIDNAAAPSKKLWIFEGKEQLYSIPHTVDNEKKKITESILLSYFLSQGPNHLKNTFLFPCVYSSHWCVPNLGDNVNCHCRASKGNERARTAVG